MVVIPSKVEGSVFLGEIPPLADSVGMTLAEYMKKITVKVIPKSGRNTIEEVDPDNYVVRISVVPEKGKANDAVAKMVAKYLKVAPSLLELVSGSKSRTKVFRVG